MKHPLGMVKHVAARLRDISPEIRPHLKELYEVDKIPAHRWHSLTLDAYVAFSRLDKRPKLSPEDEALFKTYVDMLGDRQRGRLGGENTALGEKRNVRLSLRHDKALTLHAAKRNVSVQAIIRDAVEEYIVRHGLEG